MRVIRLKMLREFWMRHPHARRPMRQWYRDAFQAKWQSLHDVRQTCPHADAVSGKDGSLTVFNIGGNKYRLVVRIRYDYELIDVRAVLTHEQYDAGKWKE